MFNKSKITLHADEKVVYKAEKGLYQMFQAFIIIIMLYCVFILIYKFIPGPLYPVIYSHTVFSAVLVIVGIRAFTLYKNELTELVFTDKRIIAVSPTVVDEFNYKDIYDIQINRNKHKLAVYLFNGKVYIYSNYKYDIAIQNLIKDYCPHLLKDNPVIIDSESAE